MDGRNRERLRQAREVFGWSQEDMATLLEITPHTIGLWESGQETPPALFRQRLCELFERSPHDLDLEEEESHLASFFPMQHTGISDPLIPLLSRIPLVGREQEIVHLQQHLCAPHPPPVFVLQGLPGVGKTTLASVLTHDPLICASFPDGVLWASLGVHPDLHYQLVRWGTLLGSPSTELSTLRHEDYREALRRLLQTRQMLLVLDDAWTVEDTRIFQLGGPQCAHLITTRFPRIATDLGDGESLVLRELGTEDSLDLLHLLAPQIVEHEAQQAHALVQMVGGLPLALTLTGNYLRVQSYAGQTRRIQTALEQVRSTQTRLHLREPRSLIDRHPSLPNEASLSLHSVIAVSDEHLPPEVRSTLYALSVFPAKPESFSKEAALIVAACPPNILTALIEMGLLEQVGDDRYRQHQTIADYAHMQLTSSQPYDRLLHYACTFTEAHQTDYELLDQESQVILHALEAAFTQEKQQAFLLRLVCAFAPFLLLRGNYTLAQRYLLRAQQAALMLDDQPNLVNISVYLGELTGKQGDYAQAKDFLQQGLALARRLGNSERICALVSLLGRSLWKQGMYTSAEAALQEGLTLARQIGREEQISELLATLGAVAASMGNYAQSEMYLEEGLQFASHAGGRKQRCTLLMNLGATITELGRYEQACGYFEEGLALARQIGHHERTSALLCNLGAVATLQGNYTQAEVYQREGLSIARQIGHREWMSILVLNLGETALAQEKYTQAALYFQETVKLAQQLKRPQLIARALYEQVNLSLKQQEIKEAEATLTEMLTIIPQNDRELQALAQYGQARLSLAQGNTQKAQQLGEASAATLEHMRHHDARHVRLWLTSITPAEYSP